MVNQEEQEQEQRRNVKRIQAIGNLEVIYECKKTRDNFHIKKMKKMKNFGWRIRHKKLYKMN